jgi:transcription-repair coupling factor (superfamily II helicase)
MKIQELLEIYCSTEEVNACALDIQQNKARVHLNGLMASSSAIIAASVFQLKQQTHVFVFNNTEDAGYFFSDLFRLME